MTLSLHKHPENPSSVSGTGLNQGHKTSLASGRLPGRRGGQQRGQILRWAGPGMVRSRGQFGQRPSGEREVWSVASEGTWPRRLRAGLGPLRGNSVF